MLAPKFIPFAWKQVVRHRTRSLLTIAGVATAMFLYCAVEAMQQGVEAATQATAQDTTLVVYRENRYCPATSRLPEFYRQRIAQVPGVTSVVPMKVVVNNCRTSLDVVTFRGVPPGDFVGSYAEALSIRSGSLDDWRLRSDAALLGETLANRRGLKPGDRFDAAGVTVYVAGVVHSDEASHQNVAYVHLDFLQQTVDQRLGTVTQFNVKVSSPDRIAAVSRAIDAEFATAQEPTQTSAEKAFVARAAKDVIEIVNFTRWLGLGALAAVLALIANAMVLSVQDRVREHAVLQTLGFGGGLIARLIVFESLILGLAGGLLGTLVSAAILEWGQFSLTNEGLSIHFRAAPKVWAMGLGVSLLLGIAAGLVPAWQASRRAIATSFRAV